MFIIGVIFGWISFIILALTVGTSILSRMMKRGHYASAYYDSERRLWKVRGRYLCVAEKIQASIKGEGKDDVKYID